MGDITLKKALDEYKTIYMAYRNFADRTRVEYQNDLEDFIEFAEKSSVIYAKEVGLPIVERFIAGQEQKGYSSMTRKRKVVTIRSFLMFLYQDGYIHTNVGSKIILPFTESTTPHILTQAECDLLRVACASNVRDAAIVEILLQTGIKLSELIHLTVNDLDLGNGSDEKVNGYVRIVGGRGRKGRMVPLNAKATFSLRCYLDKTKPGNGILFLNRFDEPLGERGVQKMLRKYLKKAGIKRASIHTLRHTFGAHRLAQGMSLKSIQEVMGYRDSRSTTVYRSLAGEVSNREIRSNSL